MYITNKPEIAKIAENSGVDRIFIDMEFLGKGERQKNLDSVKNHHTLEDVRLIKNIVKKAQILVRVNSIRDCDLGYISNKEEIDGAIENGADIIMLPYFKTVEEVEKFISLVNGRAKTMLLLETIDAVRVLDDILKIKGIDEIHIGLNDLSLTLNQKFMFEPLASGLIDEIVNKIKKTDIPFGFGGVARLGLGDVPSENVITEHYRLGSSFVILSRSFCDAKYIADLTFLEDLFNREVKRIRNFEKVACGFGEEQFEQNRKEIIDKINRVVNNR